MQPRVIIIAGPNGAGKTTFAREFLPQEGDCPIFINADLIAAGLSPFAPERAAVLAARLTLKAIAESAARRESFSFETTLSGVGYARQIRGWRESGYRVKLFFLGLPTPEAAVARVAERVSRGGHDIPEAVIRRRFLAGRRLFEAVYKTIVDDWALYDNTGETPILLDSSFVPMPSGKSVNEPTAPYGGFPPDADPDLRGSYHAMIRAAERARELARQAGTDLIQVKDGRVVRVKPDAVGTRS
jgi:predicted ABC-type ATPase